MKRTINITLICGNFILWGISLLYLLFLRIVGYIPSAFVCFPVYVVWTVSIMTCIIFVFEIVFLFKAKNKLKCSIISFIISLLLFFGLNAMLSYSWKYISDFSQEKWNQYVDQRYLMVESLKIDHKIIGYSYDDMVSLLGSPDYLSDSNTYCEYSSGNRVIEIYLSDEGITSIRERCA